MVLIYTQPLPRNGERRADGQPVTPGGIYPGPSLCPVDEGGNFSCDLDYAGDSSTDGQRTFRFYAAIVDQPDAYDAAAVSIGADGRTTYRY